MATSTRISLEQYFRTHFEGECELVDGELRPKPMGTLDHSRVQARLRDALRRYEQAGKGEAIAEMSLRMNDTVLVPDFVFSHREQQPDEFRVFNFCSREKAQHSMRCSTAFMPMARIFEGKYFLSGGTSSSAL